MKVRKLILNLVKLALAISLFVGFIGCEVRTTTTPTSSVFTPNGSGANNNDNNDSRGRNEDNQPSPPVPQSSPPVPIGFFIENRYNQSDSSQLELGRSWGVTTAEVEETDYLFVAGRFDDGVSVFEIDNDGSLFNVHNFNKDDEGGLKLDEARDVTTAVVGERTYFFVSAAMDNAISVFSVEDNGSLVIEDSVNDGELGVDGSDLELNGAAGVTTAKVGGTTYLFAAGLKDDGVSVFSVANNGMLNNVTNVSDDDDLELDGASGVTTAEVGGTTYLFVTGAIDDGMSVFSVANDGMLDNVTNVTNGGALELDGAIGVTTAKVGETTYLFVAARNDDGVSVFSVANDGMLNNVTSVSDGGDLELYRANGVTTAEVDGKHYLFVAGAFDNGMSVFSIENDGMLNNVTNVSDDGPNGILELNGASRVTTTEVGGKHYLFVVGYTDHGVSVFEFGLR